MKNRRDFIKASLLAGATLGPVGKLMAKEWKPITTKIKPLNILILGGTSFLGPHQIAYALERGHSISTFTRGKTVPTIKKSVFDNVEQLIGDRADNLEALKGRKWDAVIDNSGNKEEWTRMSAELLKDNVGLYLYTSSTGVFYPYLGAGMTEDSPVVMEMPDNLNEMQELEYGFGVMKARSEVAAKAAFGDRTIIVRPTYMMGPGDRTDRFTYWPVRLQKGGEIMVPGKANDPVQHIDVRDVAEYMIRLIETGTTGTSNAVGPAGEMTMSEFVHGAHAAFSSPAKYTHVSDYSWLSEKYNLYDMVPWIVPTGENYGSARVNFDKAISQGLTYRPLADSVRDIYYWWMSDAVTQKRRNQLESGIMAQEAEMLTAWKKR
ncbi:2'-hydroxyisoflavone reductase [Spirosomataceae bacterium TFI 002]|nr:2'-hydroxyisoflavone reductase [Spirosomataceae bacterium TFI 002]